VVEISKQRWTVLALLALGFASGGIAVAYEVVWTRELLNLLGSTTAASAATLAAFMAGIAVGSWLAGRVSELVGEPLWLFVGAEGLLAGFGLSFSAMLSVLSDTFLPSLATALQGEGAGHAQIYAHPKIDPLVFGQIRIVLGYRSLCLHGGSHGVHHAWELRQHPVAHELDDAPMIFGDLRIDDVRAEGLQSREGALLVGPDEARVAHDVGGQDRR
jgi:hypothetical protein